MSLDRRSVGALGVAVLAAGIGIGAGARFAAGQADAAEGASVKPVFEYELPNLPGQKMTGVLVEYGPGASSPPHHHTTEGSVVAYVLEGAIRSKVNDGPETVYQAGESWLEPPGAAHSVSANASTTERQRCSRCSSPGTAPSSPRSTSNLGGGIGAPDPRLCPEQRAGP